MATAVPARFRRLGHRPPPCGLCHDGTPATCRYGNCAPVCEAHRGYARAVWRALALWGGRPDALLQCEAEEEADARAGAALAGETDGGCPRGCGCAADREAADAERLERRRRHSAIPALARPGDWS